MAPLDTHDSLGMLLAEHEPPYLSPHLPTRRRHPGVVVVPAADMPTASGVAAVFRF